MSSLARFADSLLRVFAPVFVAKRKELHTGCDVNSLRLNRADLAAARRTNSTPLCVRTRGERPYSRSR